MKTRNLILSNEEVAAEATAIARNTRTLPSGLVVVDYAAYKPSRLSKDTLRMFATDTVLGTDSVPRCWMRKRYSSKRPDGMINRMPQLI